MLEENSGSAPQDNTGQEVQPESSVDAQDYRDSFNQEKVYSQKLRTRAQTAESELEKLKARNKKMEEDNLVSQNKYKELWEKDKTDAEWARDYKKIQREKILDSIPEEKREKFEKMNLKFDALQAIAEEFATKEPAPTMKAVPGQVGVPQTDKPYSEMNDQERRAYYEAASQAKFNGSQK